MNRDNYPEKPETQTFANDCDVLPVSAGMQSFAVGLAIGFVFGAIGLWLFQLVFIR